MKALSIRAKSAEKVISAELDTVQNRCTVRTITYQDIIDALELIERRLGVPKASLDGTKISADLHAQTFPGAYKGIPESTIFFAENRRGTWYITDIKRIRTRGKTCGVSAILSDTTKAAIIKSRELFSI